MSPRKYDSGKRQAAAEETRTRILDAARGLLAGPTPTAVSVDAVAKAADVSRQTVYNTFGSKSGLLEGLFDALAAHSGMHLADAFRAPDLPTALAQVADSFCRFWESDRVVLRRLRGMGALDADLGRLLRERDAMRRTVLVTVLGTFEAAPDEGAIDAVWQLTGFETYDALAGHRADGAAERSAAETAQVVTAAALAILAAATAD